MFQRVLVVFENQRVCPEALTYARELALRMDSETTFLMLVEMGFGEPSYLGLKRSVISRHEESMRKVLSALSAELLKVGLSVSVALRVGDRAQELVKFLAERPPFQTIIWGSDERLPEGDAPRRGHWMRRVMGTLECPLLTVSGKERSRERHGTIKEDVASESDEGKLR